MAYSGTDNGSALGAGDRSLDRDVRKIVREEITALDRELKKNQDQSQQSRLLWPDIGI